MAPDLVVAAGVGGGLNERQGGGFLLRQIQGIHGGEPSEAGVGFTKRGGFVFLQGLVALPGFAWGEAGYDGPVGFL